ncbi:hypothetical protein KM043_008238 [Ampulex compressa]|nr:hypothetical protein KM043_008238 [Ampulex compressa]
MRNIGPIVRQVIKINSQPANLHNLRRTTAGADLGAEEKRRVRRRGGEKKRQSTEIGKSDEPISERGPQTPAQGSCGGLRRRPEELPRAIEDLPLRRHSGFDSNLISHLNRGVMSQRGSEKPASLAAAVIPRV